MDQLKKKQTSQVLVSHSGKQYVHRLVQGLLQNHYQVVFCTPLWYTAIPRWLNLLPAAFRRIVSSEISKRFFSFQGSIQIRSWPMVALQKKAIERLGFTDRERLQFLLEKEQDALAAEEVTKTNTQIIVGYEISSVKTFTNARKAKKTTVLDLAQIHFEDILEIANRHEEMKYLLSNPDLFEINQRKRKEYELADYIITLSSMGQKSLLGRGIKNEKVLIAHLGFDSRLFVQKKNYEDSQTLRLMICGTDLKRKGVGLLLKAFQDLSGDGHKLQLTVIGPAQEIDLVKENFGHGQNLITKAFMDQNNLVKEYQEADVFVFPSYLDSWAMTVLESMACGTPVIVSDSTGSKDVVEKGGGIIVRTGDLQSLKDAILVFAQDRDNVKKYGEDAKDVVSNFTWENYYKRLGEIFAEIEQRDHSEREI